MPVCYKSCKYYSILGYCNKYEERVPCSTEMIPLHPLYYFEIYYQESEDGPVKLDASAIEKLVETADKHLTSDIARNIVNYYKKHGKLSYKQRRVLAYQILHCAEEKPVQSYTDEEQGFFQIED